MLNNNEEVLGESPHALPAQGSRFNPQHFQVGLVSSFNTQQFTPGGIQKLENCGSKATGIGVGSESLLETHMTEERMLLFG